MRLQEHRPLTLNIRESKKYHQPQTEALKRGKMNKQEDVIHCDVGVIGVNKRLVTFQSDTDLGCSPQQQELISSDHTGCFYSSTDQGYRHVSESHLLFPPLGINLPPSLYVYISYLVTFLNNM